MRERAKKEVPGQMSQYNSANFRKYMFWIKLTNFSNDTTNDQLLLASGLDSSTEIGVVPGVDLTLATDEGGVGVHVGDLLEKQAVGTAIGRRSQNSGQVEDLADGGVTQHVVAEVVGAIVANNLSEADLVVDDQESLEELVRFG
jgi:hypothetical protein